jgi:hypothetical protein
LTSNIAILRYRRGLRFNSHAQAELQLSTAFFSPVRSRFLGMPPGSESLPLLEHEPRFSRSCAVKCLLKIMMIVRLHLPSSIHQAGNRRRARILRRRHMHRAIVERFPNTVSDP